MNKMTFTIGVNMLAMHKNQKQTLIVAISEYTLNKKGVYIYKRTFVLLQRIVDALEIGKGFTTIARL